MNDHEPAPTPAPTPIPAAGMVTTLKLFQQRVRTLEDMATQMCVGRCVRIISPHYNGQLFGRSEKPLTGKEFAVCEVVLTRSDVQLNIRNQAIRGGRVLYCWLSDVEFI